MQCYIFRGFGLIFPMVFVEAAMRTVASSAALRVAEFGTQDPSLTV